MAFGLVNSHPGLDAEVSSLPRRETMVAASVAYAAIASGLPRSLWSCCSRSRQRRNSDRSQGWWVGPVEPRFDGWRRHSEQMFAHPPPLGEGGQARGARLARRGGVQLARGRWPGSRSETRHEKGARNWHEGGWPGSRSENRQRGACNWHGGAWPGSGSEARQERGRATGTR